MGSEFDPEKEARDAYEMHLATSGEIARVRMATGELLPPEQRRFAELYVGECRFSVRACSRRLGNHENTLRGWREKSDVQRYMAALMREAASKLAITRDSILGELGRVAFSDIAHLMDDISRITAELVEELGDGVTGEKIIARLKPLRSAAIKSVKFDSVIVKRTTTSADGDQVVEERVVPAIKEITLHDKLSALQTLAPWFGLEPGAFSDDDTTKDNLPALFEVLAPERREGDES